jgi:hypothetical protein
MMSCSCTDSVMDLTTSQEELRLVRFDSIGA